ncbi:MAG: hypothetical protein A2172_03465 [Candidatus Woykebacteria bacterium RBG_13_40_15]|uniref:Uncharacterized protein n=1 Tax=Candidatus Woykebacteria bacterium RBG_13_40_15 TaxID=1802593 RepID=A0A1G1W5S3_9BACT|nr:MAG: hypothetical protein A2172_03465 [Candidatus Woykebacteria bacterium RBG_13_40_15]
MVKFYRFMNQASIKSELRIGVFEGGRIYFFFPFIFVSIHFRRGMASLSGRSANFFLVRASESSIASFAQEEKLCPASKRLALNLR